MDNAEGASMERIDPLLVEADNTVDQKTMELHLQRYEFAAKYAVGKDVVDCACGTGYGSEILARADARGVIGVDLSEEAIGFAREHHAHPVIEFRVSDALTFTPDDPPSLWVSLETVEHLQEPETYLRSIHQKLGEDGILIASVPTTVSTDGNPYHCQDFTPKSWRALLARCGFAIEDELVQVHRFALKDIFGKSRGARQKGRRSLIGFYLTHPRVFFARVWLTLTRGLVNEYVTVCARRVAAKAGSGR